VIVNRDSFAPRIVSSCYLEPQLPEPDPDTPKASAELDRDSATYFVGPLRQGLRPGLGVGICGAATPIAWAI
jgi:hypothetical protein